MNLNRLYKMLLMKNKDKMVNHKFELAISILVHENCEFVNLQFKNIRKFYPNALVIIHVSEFFWKHKKNEITKIADNYNVIINPKHFKTGWCSPSIFNAMISNKLILNEFQDWTHYIFLSSNELFYKNKFEDIFKFNNKDFEYPKVYQFQENIFNFNYLHNEAHYNDRRFDINYLKILNDYNLDICISGCDYGRLMNRKSFELILNLIIKYNFFMADISFQKHYSQSELIIPTLLYLLEQNKSLIIEKSIHFVYWPSEYEIAKKSQEVILFKHVNRNIHDSFVKKIMNDIGITYNTNLFQNLNTLFPEIKRRISNTFNKYF